MSHSAKLYTEIFFSPEQNNSEQNQSENIKLTY